MADDVLDEVNRATNEMIRTPEFQRALAGLMQGKPPSECDGFSCDDCGPYGCPWAFGEDDA